MSHGYLDRYGHELQPGDAVHVQNRDGTVTPFVITMHDGKLFRRRVSVGKCEEIELKKRIHKNIEWLSSDGSNTATYEEVDHPPHYNQIAGIECIDVIEHMTHNVGAAVKYCFRHGQKPGQSAEKDLRKAIWYLEREIKRLTKTSEVT